MINKVFLYLKKSGLLTPHLRAVLMSLHLYVAKIHGSESKKNYVLNGKELALSNNVIFYFSEHIISQAKQTS